MAKPSDQFSDGPDSSIEEGVQLRKIAMLDCGFREELEPSVLRPRILGIKPLSHPKDRRNMKFVVLALIISALIIGILEYKQLREAAHDTRSHIKGLMDKK